MSGTSGSAAGLPLQVEALCRSALGPAGVDGAGVALLTHSGNRATVCATDGVAARLEEAQFVLGEGPCVDATTGRTPVLLEDLRGLPAGMRARWPGFLPAAEEAGVGAVFAFPLRLGAVAFGALDLYRCEPGPLLPPQLRAALLTADAAALLLLELTTGDDGLSDPPAGSRAAFRYEVHAAAGMVKVQLGRTIEQALMQLRATAFAQDRSVDEVALDVLEGRLRFDQEDP